MADPRFPLAPRSGTGGSPSAPLAGRTGSPDAGGAKARQESESRKVVEESKSGWRLATKPLPHKTATWTVQPHDLAITQTLLQNVKDISPHILVPQT